jgi:GAF domain-containing protein
MQRLMLAPLRAGGQPIGLIASFGRQSGAWAKGAEDALSSLATLAGGALAASLRREVELNQAREVETSALVERCVALLAGRAIDSREAMRFIQRRSMNSRQSRRRVAASFLLAEALKGASKALAA